MGIWDWILDSPVDGGMAFMKRLGGLHIEDAYDILGGGEWTLVLAWSLHTAFIRLTDGIPIFSASMPYQNLQMVICLEQCCQLLINANIVSNSKHLVT